VDAEGQVVRDHRDRSSYALVDELHYLAATEALALFRARTLSPVELMKAVIARAEAVEPLVNALPLRFFDEALEAARKAEARYLDKGLRPRPLEGIPVAIKEETPITGQPWTNGSLAYRDAVADRTAVCAERILRAGGIVHARSAAPEFSVAPFTHSRLWGVTRNPWNLDYSSGGSSGGSGAALAAGTATLASGSDIGGSIRIPASFCGVVGFKPPYGRVPEVPPYNLDHWCHEGPLARTVSDCALFENVIAGPHPSDVASLRPKLRIPGQLRGIEGWRIALSVDLGGFPVDEDVVGNTLAAVEAFREAGAVVEELDLGWDHREIARAARIHFGSIFAPLVGAEVREHRDLMAPYTIAFAEAARKVRKEDFAKGLEIEGRVYERLGWILERHRLLICPTFSVPALEAGEDYLERGPVVNGVEQRSLYQVLMTAAFNLCSRCPVLSVPSGFARTGVPTGLSIVGRTYDDVSVFRAAAAFERLRPWLDAPERRPSL
jgi:aspartyl-tRNA(Asn)/glutamyl-tRNA(Gln) amidotransferase subunit A